MQEPVPLPQLPFATAASLRLDPLKPGMLQKAGLLPKLSKRSDNFKKEVRDCSAQGKAPKTKRSDISIENRLLSVDILKQKNIKKKNKAAAAAEKSERENPVEMFAVHTEIVEGIKPHTFCLTLLSSVPRNESESGAALWELCSTDRLLVKVYDLVSSQEAVAQITQT
jgi:hypothetical protein